MENNNRDQQNQQNSPNQQNQSDNSNRNREQNQGQQGNRENVAGKEESFENPQDGAQWDNYRSRSLGSNPEGGQEPTA